MGLSQLRHSVIINRRLPDAPHIDRLEPLARLVCLGPMVDAAASAAHEGITRFQHRKIPHDLAGARNEAAHWQNRN